MRILAKYIATQKHSRLQKKVQAQVDSGKTNLRSYTHFGMQIYRKDARLPVQLQRAMAAEAEAAREARAKVSFILYSIFMLLLQLLLFLVIGELPYNTYSAGILCCITCLLLTP